MPKWRKQRMLSDYPVKLRYNGAEISGMIADVTTEGARFVGRGAFPPGAPVTLNFQSQKLPAHVRWTRRDQTGSEMGLEFDWAISPEMVAVMRRLVRGWRAA